MATQFEMVKLFRSALELCRLRADETAIVLSEGDIRADYAAACLLAARDIGANAFQVNVAQRSARTAMIAAGRNPVVGNRKLVEVLKGADIVIDLMGMLFSHEQEEICATGTRMLFIHEPFDILARNFPDTDLRRRIEWGETLLREAKELRIWSDTGTDATYKLGIAFEGWSAGGQESGYFHPFPGTLDVHTQAEFFRNAALRRTGVDVPANPDRFYLAGRVAARGGGPHGGESFPFDLAYGYHFDAYKLGAFLRDHAVSQGVTHLARKVVRVRTH